MLYVLSCAFHVSNIPSLKHNMFLKCVHFDVYHVCILNHFNMSISSCICTSIICVLEYVCLNLNMYFVVRISLSIGTLKHV